MRTEVTGAVPRHSAGLALIGPTTPASAARVLLLRRSDKVPGAGLWNLPGGRVDPGETPYATALREAHEEAGYSPERHGGMPWTQVERCRERWNGIKCYTTLVWKLQREFTPALNWESDAWAWVTVQDALAWDRDRRTVEGVPFKLHPGLRDLGELALSAA